MFANDTACPQLESLDDLTVFDGSCKYDGFDAGLFLRVRAGFNSSHAGHIDIQQDDIRGQLFDEVQALLSVRALADDFRLGSWRGSDGGLPEHRMIIDNDDSNRPRFFLVGHCV